MDLTRVAVIAAGECIRQHVGIERLSTLLRGYELADSLVDFNVENIITLAGVIEPDNGGVLRSTPVTFSGGGSSANAEDIPRLLAQLVDLFHEGHLTASEFTREFLWIHPFADGNGRTAWVLFNVLSDTMDAPEPLPYFDFDRTAGEVGIEQVINSVEVIDVDYVEGDAVVKVGSRALGEVVLSATYQLDYDGERQFSTVWQPINERYLTQRQLLTWLRKHDFSDEQGQQLLTVMNRAADRALSLAVQRGDHYLGMHTGQIRTDINQTFKE